MTDATCWFCNERPGAPAAFVEEPENAVFPAACDQCLHQQGGAVVRVQLAK